MSHGRPVHASGGVAGAAVAATGLARPRALSHAPVVGRSVWPVAGLERGGAPATWPGRGLGIRGPEPDETALSWAEVAVALAEIGPKPLPCLANYGFVAMEIAA